MFTRQRGEYVNMGVNRGVNRGVGKARAARQQQDGSRAISCTTTTVAGAKQQKMELKSIGKETL